jgi:hypothetical protein
MKKKRALLLFCLLVITVNVYSQNAKPDFRVIISTVTDSSEDETKPKDIFTIGEAIKIKVEITNLSSKRINVPKGPGFSRPILFRDGQLVPYKEETRKRFETGVGVGVSGMLSPKPNETQTDILDLNEFYEPLGPGKYQLSLERRFFKVEDTAINIPSNAVMVEVVCSKK